MQDFEQATQTAEGSTSLARSGIDQQTTQTPSNLALILENGDNDDELPVKKRARTTTDYTRRKRVPVACQFCRLRKVKCDNTRPNCGYCVRHQARCVYGETDAPQNVAVSSSAENKPSDQNILARLDEIKGMLERLQVAAPSSTSCASSTTSPWASNSFTISPETVSQHQPIEASISHQTRARCSRPDTSPFMAFRCEAMLKWPVLGSIVSEADAQVDSFLLVPEPDMGSENDRLSLKPRGLLPDEELTPLTRKFLTVFHPRNPILDGQKLVSYARTIDENGLKWDSSSCLVLLVCAIAAASQPWRRPGDFHPDSEEAQSSVPFLEDKAEAEAFFLAAKKRLGLLKDTLLDIQCLFLAFIYEKTFFRHLQAWFYLQQAATRLQVHLLRSGTRPWAAGQTSGPSDLHIEQRLFWSCFRAEREFLLEIDLPPSRLGDLSYPDPLPEPPISFPPFQASVEVESVSPTNYDAQFEERGWCYYLAEISLRRTIDDTLRHLSEDGEESWLKNPVQLVRQFHELEKQRMLWRRHLPPIVQFDETQVPDNEFAHGLRGRFHEWEDFLLRPILYYVLHSPYNQNLPSDCIELAERAVNLASQRIHELQHTLRHGGSWFITRRIFSFATLVLAVVIDPNRRIEPPTDWKATILVALRTLRFWSRDAADVRHMASTLDHMYSAVSAEIGESPSSG